MTELARALHLTLERGKYRGQSLGEVLLDRGGDGARYIAYLAQSASVDSDLRAAARVILDAPGSQNLRDALEQSESGEAWAWTDYYDATAGQFGERYESIELWAWSQLQQRLQTIRRTRGTV